MSQLDGIKWSAHAHIDKYTPDVVQELTEYLGYEPSSEDYKRLSITPDDVIDVPGNLLTTVGLARITNLITNTGATQALTAARGALGVGDRGGSASDTAAVGDTALTANGSNAYYMTLDSVTPSNGVITVVATYASGVANFAWNEWAWVVTNSGTITPGATLASIATGGMILNHKTPATTMGTKASGASWVFTTTVTLS